MRIEKTWRGVGGAGMMAMMEEGLWQRVGLPGDANSFRVDVTAPAGKLRPVAGHRSSLFQVASEESVTPGVRAMVLALRELLQ